MTVVRPARSDDWEEICGVLVAAGLPVVDLAGQFPRAFVVVLEGGEKIVGVAGLEVYEDTGLLRSVAVAASHRNEGLGRNLIEDRLRAARAQQLSQIYLLTSTAAEYFARLGFERVPRYAAPDALAHHSEFTTICAASAACMRLLLG